MAAQPDLKIFVQGESDEFHERYQEAKTYFQSHGIELLDPLPVFSLTRFAKTWRSIRELKRSIRELDIDLVHFSFATPHAIRAPFLNTPFMITTRGSDVLIVSPSLLAENGLRGLHDRMLFRLIKKAFNRAKRITSTSTAQIENIGQLFGQHLKPELLRTGVDVQAIQEVGTSALPDILRNETFIFFPRYILPIYNLELQIETIGLLSEEIKERYTFVFLDVGKANADYTRAIRKKIEALDAKTIILGELSQKEMWSCFHRASLTVMTPHSDGTPNSALEAFAAKCPVIMGNLPYDESLFGASCIQLEADSAKHLKRAIEKALHDYPADLIETAFHRVHASANLNKTIDRLAGMYRDIAIKP